MRSMPSATLPGTTTDLASPRRVALFDFDKTVIDCSSADLWFKHEWRAGRLPLSYAARVPLWVLQYKLGVGDLDWIFTDAFVHMRGQDNAIIEPRVRDWFNAEVKHRVRPGAQAVIEQHRQAGDLLVVATSSSHYVADMAKKTYGFEDAICTRLEIEKGLLTGHITSAIGKNKLVRAMEWAQARKVSLADCTFYTDSINDLSLLEKVGHPVAVNPDRRLNVLAAQRGWPILDWGISDKV